jgi:hypothetical protein
VKRVAIALAAAGSAAGALLLLLWAAFPYIYAESGSARYAAEHRGEAVLQVLGAAALVWVAWWCIRHSLTGRSWLVIAGVLVVGIAAKSFASYRKTPDGLRPAGGNWYVVATHDPTYFDTVYYSLYYKNGMHYREVDDLVSAYRFVPPDCFTFRGLTVSHRPRYVMCGFHSPAGSYDTTVAESTLMAKARTQPAYQDGWESIVQQQDFHPERP